MEIFSNVQRTRLMPQINDLIVSIVFINNLEKNVLLKKAIIFRNSFRKQNRKG
jgi:hypothetical protein